MRAMEIQQNLVLSLDTLAEARGEIGLGLIQVYRALRGGWQIRLTGCEPTPVPLPSEPGKAPEILPTPTPQSTPGPPSEKSQDSGNSPQSHRGHREVRKE